jgi:tetratricopeptide (TPR) repeat protein
VIQKANDLVWAERWREAVSAYHQALTEFPDNDSALMGYAWALLNANERDEALKVYERLTKIIPADPGPWERMAEILDHKGEKRRAADTYLQAAACYAKQGLTAKQVSALEAVVRLRPREAVTWSQLLGLYQSRGNLNRAVLAALWLSHLYQETKREQAIRLCRELQMLVPNDPRLGQMLIMLQSNRPIPQPQPIDSKDEPAVAGDIGIDDGAAEGEGGTLLDVARQRALTKLAESLFAEDRVQPKGAVAQGVDLLIGKAIDAQTRGDVTAAIRNYEAVLAAGVVTPSIHFNLGLLYKEQMQFDAAIAEFEGSLSEPEYVLGSHFALGECYQAKGDFREGLKHFIEAVKIVDTATIEREHVDDLIRVYEGLTQSLVNTGEPKRARQVSEMLLDFLGQRGWEDGAVKARRRLDELARSGAVLSLVEIISLPGSEVILKSIALAQEYQRRGKTYAALEELFNALAAAPDYLPLHQLLGVLMRENDHLEEAIDKFRTVARTYEIRGQISQALTTYQTMLEVSPVDIAVQRHVVELLIQHGRIDDALEQYMQTADAYYQLAQPERAREIYSEALRLAPRGSAAKSWNALILHRMADLDVQRLDWNAAIKDYEEILRIAPNDERAHLALFRLYPRAGRPNLGIGALDNLIKHYLTLRNPQKALAVLGDLVENQPDSIPLRTRIAQLFLNVGDRDRALEHLDILGDLQLEGGHRDAAIKTIEAILALDPPNRQAYVDLYREMAQREPPSGAT